MPKLGIRGKILALSGLSFLIVFSLSAVAQVLAHQAGTEFETRLNNYYAMQSLRVSMTEIRTKTELYLRESGATLRSELEAELAGLPQKADSLRGLEPGPGEIAFRAIAARRGLEEYQRRIRACFAALDSAGADGYPLYLSADRVAVYVDSYLAILLSASLEDGTLWYKTSSARSEIWGQITLAANLFALVAASILALLLAASISGPIRRLAQSSERMAIGDFDVDPVVAHTGDEVEVLARNFSIMSQNLRELVGGLHEKSSLEQQVHRDELTLVALDRDLKEARFYAMQSRIRPHFLFNALNTVSRTALLEEATQTEELTHRLAALMRYSLGTGEAFVTLEEELGIVREYLLFQEIRFGARLKWELRADAEVVSSRLPRFLLQPLVENAVLHGIEPLIAGGRVAVLARVRRNSVTLAVADTGCGMDRDLLRKVRSGIAATRESELGVGTASLESRLAYLYPVGVRASLYSQPGRGTLLVIRFPWGGAADAN
ncbi:MAG: histidine kinase [Spirochaetales bacterium]